MLCTVNKTFNLKKVETSNSGECTEKTDQNQKFIPHLVYLFRPNRSESTSMKIEAECAVYYEVSLLLSQKE